MSAKSIYLMHEDTPEWFKQDKVQGESEDKE